jgi:hypothetical protein
MSDVNGTEVAAEKSVLLNACHAEFVKNGSKPCDAKEAKRLVAALKSAKAARDAAEAAFIKAQKAESDAWSDIVRARGKGRVEIPGLGVFIPMSRGTTVYGRQEGSKDTPTFG